MLSSNENRDICVLLNRLPLPAHLINMLVNKNILLPIYNSNTQSLTFFQNNKKLDIPIKSVLVSNNIQYVPYTDNKQNILELYCNLLFTFIEPIVDCNKEEFIDEVYTSIQNGYFINHIKHEIKLVEINKHTKFLIEDSPFIVQRSGFSLPIISELSSITGRLCESNIIINTDELIEKLQTYRWSTLISGYFKIYMLKTEFMHNWIRSDYVLEIVIKKISNTSTFVPRLNMLFIPNTTFINGLYASAAII
jgi:hypothetical protein